MSERTVLCIGETMAMIAPTTGVAVVDAEVFRMEAGGAESNVAAALVDLGHRAAWRSRLGRDPLGERVARTLERHGVETQIEWDDERPTGLYVKDPGAGVHYYRAGSAAAHADPSLLDGIDWSDVALVHTSGITAAISPSAAALLDAVVDHARAAGVPVGFDVNHRAALWSAERAAEPLLAVARRADIVLVGLDEAQTLWGTAEAADVRELLPEPATLVVKDGAVGATVFTRDEVVFEPALAVEVVEAVGAGDAFAAGFLSGTLAGLGLDERLRRAHARAARALSSTADM